MVGIYDCFGYDVPFPDRFRYIKDAGFDSVMLWWSDKFGRGDGYQNDVRYARDAGLLIENIHSPVHEQNFISMDNLNGENVFLSYLKCVLDCYQYNISTMIIHLPNDDYPINQLGIERITKIISEAEKYNINIAFENLANIINLNIILSISTSKHAGFCYDSCHHINYAPNSNLLRKYGNRLMALHLHDNGGKRNQHQLPFDGNLNWRNVMKNISSTGYAGVIALEPMNWDYEDISIHEFLSRAYQKALKLESML